MRYLLDTCTFLWIADPTPELSERAREVFLDPRNEMFLSIASVWEIVLKHGRGKLKLPSVPAEFVPAARRRLGVSSLDLREEMIFALARLPSIHADPFDRVLVCQAQIEGLAILTPDPKVRAYPVATEW